MSKEHQFDVPAEAFEPKPWFVTRTDADAVVREIKSWVAEGNEPHLWRGHTHSSPPPTATPVYLDEFSLPDARVRAGRWAACPCCCPRDPKYGRKPGKIAWFPEERVIRMMGPDCFKALNRAGHDLAVANLEEERRRWRDEVYLLGNLDKVSRAVQVLEAGRDVALQFEKLKGDLLYPMQIYAHDLWGYIKTGELTLHSTEQEAYLGRDGEIHRRPIQIVSRYATVPVSFFQPGSNLLSHRFDTVILKLSEIDFRYPERALQEMSEEQRAKAAKILGTYFQRGRDLLQRLSEWRASLSRSSISTLRSWGQHPNSPTRFFIRREGRELLIGREATRTARVELPYFMERTVGEIPALTTERVEAATIGKTERA